VGRIASPVIAVFAALAGCGFRAHEAADDDAGGDDVDGSPGASCLDRWRAGTVALGDPTRLAELGSIMGDRDPYISPDQLTIYFSSERGLSADVFAATRTSTSAPFGAPAPRTDLSSVKYDSRVTMTADERIAIVLSDRDGGKGGNDLWIATRANRQDVFGPLEKTGVDNVNTGADEFDPELSADGLHVYIARGNPQRILVGIRNGITGSFNAPVDVGGVNSNRGDSDPALSPDERVIVFASAREISGAGDDLWYASRADKTADFGAPVRVPAVNSLFDDADPVLSADGCRLYFASLRSSNWEIYAAEVSP
jgi:hypothetical protein